MPDKGDSKEIDSSPALLMVDSASGYIQAVPLRNKNQWNLMVHEWNLMVHELLAFARVMGHAAVTFRCDNSIVATHHLHTPDQMALWVESDHWQDLGCTTSVSVWESI